MRSFGRASKTLLVTMFVTAAGVTTYAQTTAKYRPPVAALEVSASEPMPPGFSVQVTDVDGPVFVDSRGMTLYMWPYQSLQLGEVGDRKDKPSKCTDTKLAESTGFSSIYGGGMVLPDLDIRPSCLQAWPAVFAPADAKPVGKWTAIDREDGRKQWAYEGMPLYTSALDTKPGQVNGGMRRDPMDGFTLPPFREPVGPPALHPPAFQVRAIATGRILMTSAGYVAFTSDADRPNVSNCRGECLSEWAPVIAAEAARSSGEFGVIERSPGVKQWTFRKMPLYTYVLDKRRTIAATQGTSLIGEDVSGWHATYTQKWPAPPKEFTVQDSRIGQVLADRNGKTLYVYRCADDAADQLSCDHPSQTQVYRLSICGKGDAAACNKLFPYVEAPKGATVDNLLWGTAWIDPSTGHYAKPNQPGALHVWTYRDRPIFTHGRDKKPGDANGDSWGEQHGMRNGYKAFWVRDDFFGLAS